MLPRTNPSSAPPARSESLRASGKADQQIVVDVTLFMNYLDAYAREDTRPTNFLETRFRPEFVTAFDAWMATDPKNSPYVPSSPFAMPEYKLAEQAKADDPEKQSAAHFNEGEDANEHGDNYVLNTVFLASVLFFAALAARFKRIGPRSALLAIGVAILVYGLYNLVHYPVA